MAFIRTSHQRNRLNGHNFFFPFRLFTFFLLQKQLSGRKRELQGWLALGVYLHLNHWRGYLKGVERWRGISVSYLINLPSN